MRTLLLTMVLGALIAAFPVRAIEQPSAGATVSTPLAAESVPIVVLKESPVSLTVREEGFWNLEVKNESGALTSIVVRWGDGITETVSGVAGDTFSRSLPHTYRSVGVKTIRITATNSGGKSATVLTKVSVVSPPRIEKFEGPRSVGVDEAGSWSYIVSGLSKEPTYYTVEWGDGLRSTFITTSTASERKGFIEHSYASSGIYAVTFSILNNQGTDRANTSVTVFQKPPRVRVTGTRSVRIDKTGSWRVTAESDAKELVFSVLWGDGTVSNLVTQTPFSARVFTHRYVKSGTYMARFEVRDDSGEFTEQVMQVRAVASPSGASFIESMNAWFKDIFNL